MDSRTLIVARILVRERDAAIAAAERTRTMPVMHAEAEGRRNGLDMALAALGGAEFYRSTSSFIADVRAQTVPAQPIPAAPADVPPGLTEADVLALDPIPEGEQRVLDGNR